MNLSKRKSSSLIAHAYLRTILRDCSAAVLIAIAISGISSCGNLSKETESTEETTSMIEAAQLEGRGAARRVINRTFDDSLALHGAVLEATAIKSRYQMEHKPKCEAAFDSAFIETIRTTRPDLARQLE